MNNKKDLTIKEVFDLAVKNHLENKTDIAEDLYNQILKIDPNHANAHNNLGVIYRNSGKTEKAKNCYEKAIEINSNYVDAHFNLGNVFKDLKELQKARGCYEKAIEINPNYANAYYNLGIVLTDLEELPKAKKCYEKVIEINPNYVDAHSNLGSVNSLLGEYQIAINCYEREIKINPGNPKIHNILGNLFIKLDNYQKAKNHFKEANRLYPDSAVILESISRVYILELNDFDRAINSSFEALKVYQKNSRFINQTVPLFRLKHDVQQAQYLISKDYKLEGIKEFQRIGGEILNREENKENEDNYNKKILLTSNEIDSLLPFYKSDHVYKTKKISGSCINQNKKWLDIEDEYFNSSNQIMYIDDFLSDEAIIELREFCLISKVWNREYYNPFLGARPTNGFISPIHLQIAIELHKQLPNLFGLHKLSQFWGFKYDSKLGKGINIHADFALHNLNFWITPDEYNNDKNSGGLKVYDVAAPDNWTLRDYNMDTVKIHKFLKDSSANCVKIPYKFNRAVLFNSAYFHETDEIDFKDEYVGRRINNTYLFGKRLVKNVSRK